MVTTSTDITTSSSPSGYCALCGLRNRGDPSRIFGGVEASPNEYPWQVLMLDRFTYARVLCGGILIGGRFVLTAAVCKAGYVERVIIGAHDLKGRNETGRQILKVQYLAG